jgi:pyruvate/2-oxoglutarate dehydrogenase complex dihydrolipoamide dehydrogenase (E3) component
MSFEAGDIQHILLASHACAHGAIRLNGLVPFIVEVSKMTDVIVIGAGPAGVIAALRAADLGARTTLVTRAEFGGMAANDGPVPVRTLAHAARLIRDARQLGQYGIIVNEPILDYPRLLARVREVVSDARAHPSLFQQIRSLGVTVH